MTNLQIKKEILKATKRVDNFTIEIGLWHSQGYINENIDQVYNMFLIINTETNESITHKVELKYDNVELEDNEKNIKKLQSEQNKFCDFLSKQFDNVTKYEGSV